MIREWIETAIGHLRLNVYSLSPVEWRVVVSEIQVRYCEASEAVPIWESLRVKASQNRADGWREIANYVSTDSCVLFVESEMCAFRLQNGENLARLLADCPGFEFYVTNTKYDYVLCHNNHDFLIGAGAAIRWVEMNLGKEDSAY